MRQEVRMYPAPCFLSSFNALLLVVLLHSNLLPLISALDSPLSQDCQYLAGAQASTLVALYRAEAKNQPAGGYIEGHF